MLNFLKWFWTGCKHQRKQKSLGEIAEAVQIIVKNQKKENN
jgi:hypothetical protein